MTARGKIVFTFIFLALVLFGVKQWWPKIQPKSGGSSGTHASESGGGQEKAGGRGEAAIC
jgi:hypothetical protein